MFTKVVAQEHLKAIEAGRAPLAIGAKRPEPSTPTLAPSRDAGDYVVVETYFRKQDVVRSIETRLDAPKTLVYYEEATCRTGWFLAEGNGMEDLWDEMQEPDELPAKIGAVGLDSEKWHGTMETVDTRLVQYLVDGERPVEMREWSVPLVPRIESPADSEEDGDN